jgi:hypothetical protein
MSEPVEPPPAPPPREEEVDLWWGSYGGRTMTPSFVVCVLLTGVIYVVVRLVVHERGWQQLAFACLAVPLWGLQLGRWARRFFTWNYRLTTRYLYLDRGVRPLIAQRFALDTIDRVDVSANRLEEWLGVGDVRVYFVDSTMAPAVLRGLRHPHEAADVIREAAAKARQQAPRNSVHA